MSESEKQRIPTWFVSVKKTVKMQNKAFKWEDSSRFILLIGRGRHEDGEWVDDTHPYFLDVDRIEDLIKGLQEAVTAIKTNFTNRYYTLMYVGN